MSIFAITICGFHSLFFIDLKLCNRGDQNKQTNKTQLHSNQHRNTKEFLSYLKQDHTSIFKCIPLQILFESYFEKSVVVDLPVCIALITTYFILNLHFPAQNPTFSLVILWLSMENYLAPCNNFCQTEWYSTSPSLLHILFSRSIKAYYVF